MQRESLFLLFASCINPVLNNLDYLHIRVLNIRHTYNAVLCIVKCGGEYLHHTNVLCGLCLVQARYLNSRHVSDKVEVFLHLLCDTRCERGEDFDDVTLTILLLAVVRDKDNM